jgi:predicted transcriptional regulator
VPAPAGKLTPAQYEIMELVWTAEPAGATIGELWETIGARRAVLRTTVQNLVERLERRRWLRRKKIAGGYRYVAATTREQTARGLAEDFVDEFFAGSASELVMSLFGSTRLTREELGRLRKLVDARLAKKNPKPPQR